MSTTMMGTDQINLTFVDLNYSVRNGYFTKERKQILANINGNFRPGELTAIMGSSGAGKSTLMDILAGFTTSDVTGSIEVNGHARNLAAFRRSSAYIMQDDNLQPLLTVHEAMSIAADLKLESNRSNLEKQQCIDAILKQMSLDPSKKTLTRDLSGGQRKRLSIALELISNPPIMFFDEPLTGLDNVTSRQTFGILKSLAAEGRTIVCTIHQPSASLLEMVDQLYVLAEGRCVYSGGVDNLVSYLQNLQLRCPTYHNPADYLIELTMESDHLENLVESSMNGKSDRWRRRIDEPNYNNCTRRSVTGEQNSDYYTTSSYRQIVTLLKCNAIKLSRDKVLTYLRLSMSFLISMLVGIMYYDIGQDAAYALDNFNLLFFTLLFLMFCSLNTTIITFPTELPIMSREYFNRWYKLHSFYLSHKLADLPIQLASSSIYVVTIYYMSGQLPETKRLGLFLATCLLVSLIAQTVGLIVGTILDVQTAAVLGPFTVVPSMVFSGFFVHLNDAHPSLQPLFHLSFCKYGFDAVMIAIYGFDRSKMNCSEVYCYFTSPKTILKDFGASNTNFWLSIGVLTGLYTALNFIGYLALRLKLKLGKN